MIPTFLQDWGTGQVAIYVPADPTNPNNPGVTKIGYWTKDSDLCRGVVQILNAYMGVGGRSVYPPSEWLTNNDWGLTTPVSAYCVSKGARPAWATAPAADGSFSVAGGTSGAAPVTYQVQPDGTLNTSGDAAFRTDNPATDLAPVVGQAVTDLERAAAAGAASLIPTWATGANGVLLLGAGALALFLVMRRREA